MKKQKLNLNHRDYSYILKGSIPEDPKSIPADPNSRSTLKKQYSRFWKQRIFNSNESDQLDAWVKFYGMRKSSSLQVLVKIPVKLWLDNQINEEQKNNLINMLNSPDPENATVAISLMMQLAGRRMCGGRKKK